MNEEELKAIIDRRIAAMAPVLEKARVAQSEIDARLGKASHLGTWFAASALLNILLAIALWIFV
jgi:hypothetical protein